MNNRCIVTAIFPSDLATRARIAAAKMNVSRSELLRQAVLNFLRLNTDKEERGENEPA